MIELDELDSTKILLVDDDVEYTKVVKSYLEHQGLDMSVSNDPFEALEMCKKEKYSIILLDYYMGEMTGDEFLTELRKFDTRVIVILQTGFAEEKPPVETLTSLNIQGYYDKSHSVEELLLSIISIVKTMTLLLYRNNPDTNQVEYSFMSLKRENPDDKDTEVDLDFEDNDIIGYEIESDDNNDLERSRFFKISAQTVSSKEEYERIKQSKKIEE